jgi:hypothetical protein
LSPISFSDDNFLVRYLRVKKYTNSEAFKMFEKFLVVRQVYPQWYDGLSYEDKDIKGIFDSGYVTPLAQRDASGGRVILIQAKNLDPKKFDCHGIFKTIGWVRTQGLAFCI